MSVSSTVRLSSELPLFTDWDSEIGTRDAFLICLIFSTVISIDSASSSCVGSRPSLSTIWRSTLDIREMISKRCTGRRMVRDWSEIDLVTACLIHQCA